MPQKCETFVVGVLDSSTGEPIGTGFVIDRTGLVVTSYHVIVRAINADRDKSIQCREAVRLRFPAARSEIPAFFVPEYSDPDTDIAVVEVGKLPDGIEIATLGPSIDCPGDSFVSLGYRKAAGGAVGTIAPPEPEPVSGGFARLIIRSDQIDKGMSGAPVLDTNQDRVVGMIVSTWYSESGFGKDQQTSFAVPSEAICLACDKVKLARAATEMSYSLIGSTDSVRHNLPARRTKCFVGRADERHTVVNHLQSMETPILVSGASGTGKTELALQIAHRLVKAKAFRAVVWVSRDGPAELRLEYLLDEITNVLGFGGIRNLDIVEKQSRTRSLLIAERVLLVVDGIEAIKDSEMVPFLCNLPSQSRLLMTSQHIRAIGFEETLVLKELSLTESDRLIRLLSKNKRLGTASEDDVVRIHQASGGLPVVIEWAVGQINTGRQTIEGMLDSLARPKSTPLYDSMFRSSFEKLSNIERKVILTIALSLSPVSKRLLRLTSQLTSETLDATLEQLVVLNCIHAGKAFRDKEVRFQANDLLMRSLRAMMTEMPEERQIVVQRLIRYYSDLIESNECDEILPSEVRSTLRWCDQYEPTRLIDLVYALSYFFFSSGFWAERVTWGKAALHHCRSLGNRRSETWILVNELGYMAIMRGELDQAVSYIETGLNICQQQLKQLDDEASLLDTKNPFGYKFTNALATRYLGIVNTKLGLYVKAEQSFESAMNALKSLRRRSVLANVKIELSELAFEMGDYKRARLLVEEAIGYHKKQLSSKPWVSGWIAKALCCLGSIEFREGNTQNALIHFEEALSKARMRPSTYGIAETQIELASLHIAESRFGPAIECVREAAQIAYRIGSPALLNDVDRVVLNLELRSDIKRKT